MLSVRGLHAAYDERPVLRGVDLDVGAGEVVGLVGPNGCGKTTLLRAINRSLPLKGGRVCLDEADITALSVRELARRVAVVPQNAEPPAGFSALEAVVMGRTAHLGFFAQEGAADYRLAAAALAMVGVADLRDRRVEELSGGERQKVVIARALAQEAPLLLLDEPTANLDIGQQVAVARLLRELAAAKGFAVLAAIHDLTLASLYCDRLALMAEGRIVASGAPAAVLTRENIARVYGLDAVVLRRPFLAGPAVLPLSEEV